MSYGSLWRRLVNKKIVIDTNTPYLYIGTLSKVDKDFVVLKDVDVHDIEEGTSTKEKYILEAKKYGIKVNRKEAAILINNVVSFSSLDSVIEY